MKPIIEWLIKKYLPDYELVKKEAKDSKPVKEGYHLHRNPKRKEKK